MKFKIIIILSLLSFQVINAQSLKWSDNTTNILEQGRKEMGLFSPFKMGLKNNTELSVQPLLFFVIPNAAIKKQWKNGGVSVASVHKLTYPSILYNLLSREGTGGVLPNTSIVPPIFKFNNSLLVSKIFKEQTITLKVGFDFALAIGDSDFPDIEYHIVYPRVYSLNNMFTPHVGINFTGIFYNNFKYDYNLNSFIFINNNPGLVLEHNLKISWLKSDRFAVKAGVIYTHGNYPFGKGSGIFPVFDILIGFNKK
ncbi:MAG: hypothetical protein L3J35_10165 [Bacteroidales bacterium]|nr:hypothetical protein [Bacteroidales bacterium]